MSAPNDAVSTPNVPPRRSIWLIVGVVALLGVIALVWVRGGDRIDWDAVMAANNEGIGLMERFEYAAAATAFERAVQLAPDWLPGQVNYGIAKFNLVDEPHLSEAIEIFRKVIERDPDNRHAHFCLGVIYRYQNRTAEAYAEFAAVNRLDAEDPQTWYNLGLTHPEGTESQAAFDCFLNALRLDPYLNAARYALAQHPLSLNDPDKKKVLLDEFNALIAATWERELGEKYSEFGKYAEVIGRVPVKSVGPPIGPLPMFQPFADGRVDGPAERFVDDNDFPMLGPIGGLRFQMRSRFGTPIVVFDYDQDDRPDVLVLNAIIRDGAIGSRLYHNEGSGRFRDVTIDTGLVGKRTDFGAVAADFDNDGLTDLFFTGESPRLLRNTGKKTFEDVSEAAGLRTINSVAIAATAIDIDQDGDLDIVCTQIAEQLMAALGGDRNQLRIRILVNTSEAPVLGPGQDSGPPLKLRFEALPDREALQLKSKPLGLLATDLDDDRDIDVLIMQEEGEPVALLNDRLMRFRQVPGPLDGSAQACSGLTLDANHDGEIDLFVLNARTPPKLLHRKPAQPTAKIRDHYQLGVTNAVTLVQAQAVDVDQDGRTDIVGIEESRRAVLLQQDADGRMVVVEPGFGQLPQDLSAAYCVDVDGDCQPDFIGWSNSDGLVLRQNAGNGNRGLRLRLLGRRTEAKDHRRTNLDAIGSRVIVQSGNRIAGIENTTLTAGIGQSRLPLTIGLGPLQQAQIVRVRWPDQVPQAELNLPTCELATIIETNRKPTSCPVLFTWNGERFVFISDLLGGGALGESGADGSIRPARPSESICIDAAHLKPHLGKYRLKLAEPMDEVMYLDQATLEVVDHPGDIRIEVDERFTFGNDPPTEARLALREERLPRAAVDHRGRDILPQIRARDGRFVDGFTKRAWLGYAEEHFVELDFGPELAQLAQQPTLWLVLHGGTDYPYPESIYAATQAKVPLLGPTLEQQLPDGSWRVVAEIGFPAGLTKTVTFPLKGESLRPGNGRLRIRTNMQIYWDQILLAVPTDAGRSHVLPTAQAALRSRGFAQEITPPGSPLIAYDDQRSETVSVSPWQGRLTRYGDVTPLLTAEDDRFVLCGPGDEVELSVDAANLPALPMGWKRSFILRTKGYCKDHSPFTVTGGEVGPLPFRGMKTYPPAPDEARPETQQAYDRDWNTRRAARP